MPVTYTIDTKLRLVSFIASGDVTAAELLEYQNRLTRDPDFNPAFRQLADFSQATSASVSSDDVRALATRNAFDRSARRCVVVPTAELFGLARMFQAFRELSGGKEQLHIFKERKEALDWLFSERDGAD